MFFHILTSSSGQGLVSNEAIDSQMAILNSAFSPHFAFVKRGLRVVANDAWFSMRMGQQTSEGAAKQHLRQVGKDQMRRGEGRGERSGELSCSPAA